MKKLSLLLLLVAACGGGSDSSHNNPSQTTDYNSNFTGTWRGNGTITIGTQSATGPLFQVVNAVSTNRFRFEDSWCPTVWTANNATSASVDVTNCPAFPAACSFTARITSGSFVRDGNGARAGMSGTATVASGCTAPPGTSLAFSLTTDVMIRSSSLEGANNHGVLESSSIGFGPAVATLLGGSFPE